MKTNGVKILPDVKSHLPFDADLLLDADFDGLEEILAEEGLTLESFRTPYAKLKGTRRSLRMLIEAHRIEIVDVGLRVAFALPPGGYATVVLDELLKDQPETSSA